MPLVCLQLLSINSQAQISLPQITQLDESNVNILLDGFIDEAVWQSLPIIDNMKIIDPDTLEDAPYKTDIRFFYTQQGIYFGIVNHQPAEEKPMVIGEWPIYLYWLEMFDIILILIVYI